MRRDCRFFGTVDLFDGPQIELPPTLSGWQETSEEKSGFKLQLKMGGRNRHFKEALLATPDGNDNEYFSDLLGLDGEDPGEESPEEAPQGDQRLFDCGYFSIDLCRRITDTENSFAAEPHGNIDPQLVCRRPVPEVAVDPDRNAAGYSVLEDCLVRLGDDRTDREGGDLRRWYRVLSVEVSTGEQIGVLTNLLWLEAEQICRLYKHYGRVRLGRSRLCFGGSRTECNWTGLSAGMPVRVYQHAPVCTSMRGHAVARARSR